MSRRTRILSTVGSAPSTASRASMLLWTSDRRARVGPRSSPPGEGRARAGSGVDAFVSVGEENAQRGGDRNRHEEPEDASEIAPHHERDDDQHRAEVDRVAEHLRGNEVVYDVRDDEVEDQHPDDFARGLRDKRRNRDRRQGAEKWPYEGDEGRHAGDNAERQRVGNPNDPDS